MKRFPQHPEFVYTGTEPHYYFAETKILMASPVANLTSSPYLELSDIPDPIELGHHHWQQVELPLKWS